MPQETVIPTCYACETPMVLREKNGEKFWGCPNWKSCGGKTLPYGKPRQKDKPTVIRKEPVNPQQFIIDELQDFRKEVNERLDKLGEYLAEKLK